MLATETLKNVVVEDPVQKDSQITILLAKIVEVGGSNDVLHATKIPAPLVRCA